MRTFIGGIAAHDSADHSIGVQVSERLAADAPINAARVVVGEWSSDAVEIADRLNSEWPKFERVIFVGAVIRARAAGTVTAYRWNGSEPNESEPRGPVEDADSLVFDNMLLAVKALADLPEEIIVVEVEPDGGRGGEQRADGSARPAAALERARTLVRRLATNARAAQALPICALGDAPRCPTDL
ncbi:MAG: hypothetical protein ACT4P6_00975 [Gemmatimonadaceae bacterium]